VEEDSPDKEEVRLFVFDNNSMIDIDALENFVSSNRESLSNSDSVLKIDLNQLMTVKENAASIRA
jgi:hypothetical protein